VALNTIGFSMMRIFGPALAGYLIAAFGGAGSFFVQGTLYGASGLIVAWVAFPPRQPATASVSAFHAMKEGLRFAVGDPRIRVLLAVAALPHLLLIPVSSALLPIYAKDVFAAGPEGLGFLLTGVGAGGTLGGFVANALARVERQGLVQAAWVLVESAAIAALALSASLKIAIACVAVAGVAEMALFASSTSSLQMSAPEAMRGRISSLLMLNPVLISTGALIAGLLAQAAGVHAATFILAGTAALGVAVMCVGSPTLREVRVK
jgi:MFS family permease